VARPVLAVKANLLQTLFQHLDSFTRVISISIYVQPGWMGAVALHALLDERIERRLQVLTEQEFDFAFGRNGLSTMSGLVHGVYFRTDA